jgi:hypothetical protein
MKGFVDLPHAAVPQGGDDLIAVIEQFSWVKVKIIEEVRWLHRRLSHPEEEDIRRYVVL